MIFVLLIIGAFFIIGINPFRRKSYISLAKQVQEEKFRNVDECFDRLALKDRIITTIQNTVSMGGSNMKIFSAMIAVAMGSWNRHRKDVVYRYNSGIGNGFCIYSNTVYISESKVKMV